MLAALLGAIPILFVAEPLTALHRRKLFLPGLGHDAYDHIINMIVGPLFTIGIVASVVLAARVLDRRELRDLGVVGDRRWWARLGLGFSLGALLMAAVFAVEVLCGWAEVTGTFVVRVASIPLALALGFSVIKMLCVGVYEELVSRGYWLRNLADGVNLPFGVIVSSAVFAALHAMNDNATLMSTFGLFVNGLLFAVALLVTGRLSAPIGLHIAWNLFEGAVFGFPVSGDNESASVVAIQQRGAEVITGGAFGPEAGAIGIAASLAGIAMLLIWRFRQSVSPLRP